jgi:hypothetical protein
MAAAGSSRREDAEGVAGKHSVRCHSQARSVPVLALVGGKRQDIDGSHERSLDLYIESPSESRLPLRRWYDRLGGKELASELD